MPAVMRVSYRELLADQRLLHGQAWDSGMVPMGGGLSFPLLSDDAGTDVALAVARIPGPQRLVEMDRRLISLFSCAADICDIFVDHAVQAPGGTRSTLGSASVNRHHRYCDVPLGIPEPLDHEGFSSQSPCDGSSDLVARAWRGETALGKTSRRGIIDGVCSVFCRKHAENALEFSEPSRGTDGDS